ncbi:tRNA pseudouridine synthase B [Chlamydia trachomatis A/HAR-13]|uniref:tRNA pseudouridine synthase B n=1 Tax=Chlamydia trachomatis serovar A (strain ATCC VR-571B / DSM 19440 / HAR-13) TaxID=315277 RepID=A0A0H2X1E0_CHLTA|nr:tRNA pseudouridine synthase B [Chlamydia trachomatis A/HAR-13]
MVKYEYPRLHFVVQCSKGTYIRSIAHELGNMLGCGAYLEELRRLRSGSFSIDQCIDGNLLDEPGFDVSPYLRDANGLILQPAPVL